MHQSFTKKSFLTTELFTMKLAPEFYEEIVSYYRKVYYEALDGITNAITDHSKELGIILFVQLQKF